MGYRRAGGEKGRLAGRRARESWLDMPGSRTRVPSVQVFSELKRLFCMKHLTLESVLEYFIEWYFYSRDKSILESSKFEMRCYVLKS